MLRKGASGTILPRLSGVLDITSRKYTGGRGGPILGKGASETISLRQKALLTEKESLCSHALFPRGRRSGEPRS